MAFRCPLAETAIKKCGRASSKSGIPATMHEILTTAKLFRPTGGIPLMVTSCDQARSNICRSILPKVEPPHRRRSSADN